MNTTEIKILLEKYYDGETTLDEERILKAYFTSDQVDEKLKEHIPVFAYQVKEARIGTGAGFEEKIENKPGGARRIPFYRNRTNWMYFVGIAASLLFLITFYFETRQNDKSLNGFAGSEYTEAEAKKAYQQTKTALAFVSDKYTAGMEPLGEIIKFGDNAYAVTELARFNKQLNSLNSNMGKVSDGMDNMRKLSKFTIIVKP